jgi:hypothetical protein
MAPQPLLAGVARRVVDREDLLGVARAAFGATHRLVGVDRLRGGSKKGVYRLRFHDESTAIVYRWDVDENYWPANPNEATDADDGDPFSAASGIDLFEAAHRQLETLGVRTPHLYLAERRGAKYPADIAVVEDVPGDNLEDLLTHDPCVAEATLEELAETLEVMHRHTGPAFGKVAFVARGGISRARSCEQVVLDRALGDLAEAAGRDGRMAAAGDRLDNLLRVLADQVRPRSDYGLIHGELGGDHVLVDLDGHPVIIDIEGVMFFDIEWEHAFLRLRFNAEQYQRLNRNGLDEPRLRLYKLAMHLSLVAGPLRLLDGDYPDREFMRRIAEHHLNQALTWRL